jgi:hypothetical protein
MKKYRSINEVEEEYLRNHPDEIDDYITILFDEYAESGDIASLLSSLHLVSRLTLPMPKGEGILGSASLR